MSRVDECEKLAEKVNRILRDKGKARCITICYASDDTPLPPGECPGGAGEKTTMLYIVLEEDAGAEARELLAVPAEKWAMKAWRTLAAIKAVTGRGAIQDNPVLDKLYSIIVEAGYAPIIPHEDGFPGRGEA